MIFIHRGAPLNEGSIDPKELIQVRDVFLLKITSYREVQGVYRMQGVELVR